MWWKPWADGGRFFLRRTRFVLFAADVTLITTGVTIAPKAVPAVTTPIAIEPLRVTFLTVAVVAVQWG